MWLYNHACPFRDRIPHILRRYPSHCESKCKLWSRSKITDKVQRFRDVDLNILEQSLSIPWIGQDVYTTAVVLMLRPKHGKQMTSNIPESDHPPVILYLITKRSPRTLLTMWLELSAGSVILFLISGEERDNVAAHGEVLSTRQEASTVIWCGH